MKTTTTSNLTDMQNNLKAAIREYFVADNTNAILEIQSLTTKLAVLHGFSLNEIFTAEAYSIHLDEYCKKMSMSYSYKAVFILGMIGNAKDIIPMNLTDLSKWFIKYYRKRIRSGQIPEKNGIFCEREPEVSSVIRFLKQKQIPILQRDGIIEFDGDLITFSNRVFTEDKLWAKNTKIVCMTRLSNYFDRFSNNGYT